MTVVEAVMLSPAQTVQWVGSIVLNTKRDSTKEISISHLTDEWGNFLPESWREQIDVSLLKVSTGIGTS